MWPYQILSFPVIFIKSSAYRGCWVNPEWIQKQAIVERDIRQLRKDYSNSPIVPHDFPNVRLSGIEIKVDSRGICATLDNKQQTMKEWFVKEAENLIYDQKQLSLFENLKRRSSSKRENGNDEWTSRKMKLLRNYVGGITHRWTWPNISRHG